MSIDWSAGQVVTLRQGDTATLGELDDTQLYGVFLYNSAMSDGDAEVTVTWSNDPRHEPVTVTVPGTTQDQGPAVVRFLSGGDAAYISVAVGQDNPRAQVTAFICSVKLPIDGGGLHNQQLPDNGKAQRFQRLTRFYCVPAARWYSTTIRSDVDEFTCIRFTESFAQVTVVNKISDPAHRIQGIGEAEKMFTIETSGGATFQSKLEGDGAQQVWINADSVQDSEAATLVLQRL
ncbi:hypothetical protein [Amycolatopsis rifamycinica]|uniref:Uncharacterized protein n=1 Tax=Amycolatopsis rifamycinica TaxID=287986 RepID=A0A066UEL0_9PSEU|nr:hypothetical protein [Amycolatopsis rifamycinica]KDN22633.1 hypothetical protein DV20_07915 [Amycolatopsis rifamycinica]